MQCNFGGGWAGKQEHLAPRANIRLRPIGRTNPRGGFCFFVSWSALTHWAHYLTPHAFFFFFLPLLLHSGAVRSVWVKRWPRSMFHATGHTLQHTMDHKAVPMHHRKLRAGVGGVDYVQAAWQTLCFNTEAAFKTTGTSAFSFGMHSSYCCLRRIWFQSDACSNPIFWDDCPHRFSKYPNRITDLSDRLLYRRRRNGCPAHHNRSCVTSRFSFQITVKKNKIKNQPNNCLYLKKLIRWVPCKSGHHCIYPPVWHWVVYHKTIQILTQTSHGTRDVSYKYTAQYTCV